MTAKFPVRSRLLRRVVAILLGIVPALSVAHAATPAVHTVVLVRHAEKAAGDAPDPELADRGRASAERLADTLRTARVDAVYSTPYRRTRQTAQPTAAAHGLEVLVYDPSVAPDRLADVLRRQPAGGTVLVVGHSNTVPALTAALCRCAIPPMAEGDYGRYYRLELAGDAPARVTSGTW